MKKYLYPDGSEKRCWFCESFISILYILGVVALTWGIVDFVITFFTERGSLGYWFTTVMWSGWFGCAMLYFSVRDSLPILAIRDKNLVIYKGLIARDRINIDDIKHIEAEFHDETGIQILITLTSGSRFYAEIVDNSCSMRLFSLFLRKYAPRIKIKSGYKLNPELAANDKQALDLDTCSEDELFSKLKLAKLQGNDELALRILHCLYRKEFVVEGFMADIYLGAGGEFNDKKALKLYREGYDRGSQHAAIGLAMMHYEGIEVKEDKKRAFEYLKFAEGYRDAIRYYYLGLLYFDGVICGSSDEEKAAFFFKKTIVYGSANGYLGLAMISGKKKEYCKTFKLGLKHIKAEQVS